jgi:hypothetical protein
MHHSLLAKAEPDLRSVMRISGILLLAAVCAICVTACSQAQRQERVDQIPFFWSWFQTNQQALFSSDNPGDMEHVSLGEKLKRIEDDLTYEIGRVENGKREMAVSADGILELFPLVEKIVKAAPKMEKWKVVAFRQRVAEANLKELAIKGAPVNLSKETAKEEGVEIAVRDMRAAIERTGDKARITVFIKGYNKQESQDNLALVMLQQALGEYDMVMKVGDIKFASTQEANEKNSFPFVKLGSVFDKVMAQKN